MGAIYEKIDDSTFKKIDPKIIETIHDYDFLVEQKKKLTADLAEVEELLSAAKDVGADHTKGDADVIIVK